MRSSQYCSLVVAVLVAAVGQRAGSFKPPHGMMIGRVGGHGQAHDTCLKEVGISEAGVAKVKELTNHTKAAMKGMMDPAMIKKMASKKEDLRDIRKKVIERNENITATLKETDGAEKAEAFNKCLRKIRMPRGHEECANSTGVSDAGREKLKTVYAAAFEHEKPKEAAAAADGEKKDGEKKEGGGGPEIMKAFKEKFEKAMKDGKAALEETDKDKVEAWEKCMAKGHGRNGHGKGGGHGGKKEGGGEGGADKEAAAKEGEAAAAPAAE